MVKPLNPKIIEEFISLNRSYEVSPNNLLEGRTAIVTGCSSGIGFDVARTFLREGAKVFGVYSSNADEKIFKKDAISNLEIYAKEHGFQDRLKYIDADLSQREVPERVVEETVSSFGKNIHAIANVAGNADFHEKLEDITYEDFEKRVRANLLSSFFIVQKALPYIKNNDPIKGQRGSIINMGSINGISIGEDGVLDYTTTKAGMQGLTYSLMTELGPQGIRANMVSPGCVVTPINYRDFGNESRKKQVEKRTATKQWNFPQQVANTVLFYASDQSIGITGDNTFVDNGIARNFKLE